jgi:hypothetical protein
MVLVAHQGSNCAEFVHHANGVAVGDVDFAIGSDCNPCKRKILITTEEKEKTQW